MSQFNLNDTIISEVQLESSSIYKILNRIYKYFIKIKRNLNNWLDRKEKIIILKKMMEDADNYQEWKKIAKELDILEGKEQWKQEKDTGLYDYKEVEKLIRILSHKREIKDVVGLVHYIRINLMKNLYSTFNPALYQNCNTGTKYLIQEFEEEMLKSLEYIANFNEKNFPVYKKIEFFSEARHSYGRTALLLSGGASLGMFHTGVVKSLHETNMLPKIVCGSSAGSFVAALLCTETIENTNLLFDRELKLGPFQYKESSLLHKFLRYVGEGVLLDMNYLSEYYRENLGDMTFQEAFDKTGRILNITVTGYEEHDNMRLLNYLTSPNVLIWSACSASSCVPGIYGPVELLSKNEYGQIVPYNTTKKKFIDGSVSYDLPMQRISELFNVNIFIVSQVLPWVIPFLDTNNNAFYYEEKNRYNLWRMLKNLSFSEIRHRCSQLQSLGIFPTFIQRFFNMITQEYTGHVTLFPIPSITDFMKVMSNPNKAHIEYCTKHSCKRTYPKLSYIEAITKFEFALEKHQKKLKAKLNKFDFPMDKKYKLDDEEAFDDYQTNMILNNAKLYNTEERKQFNLNLQDLMNIKTEFFTNSSNTENVVNNNLALLPPSSGDEEEIMDECNELNFEHEEIKDLTCNFSNISLLPHKKRLRERSKTVNLTNKDLSSIRHSSFLIPREKDIYKKKKST